MKATGEHLHLQTHQSNHQPPHAAGSAHPVNPAHINQPSRFSPRQRLQRPCQTAIMIPGTMVDAPALAYQRQADPNKTELLGVPSSGLVRSPRGTIEAVYQKNGRIISPQYSPVGILQAVRTSDGLTFTLTADRKSWCILDKSGKRINTTAIKSVYFDKQGNLIYNAVDGCRTIMTVDGRILLDKHHFQV